MLLVYSGFNNNWFIQTKSDLAIRFNDKAVLENYHVSLAFHIMQSEKDFDVFSGLPPADYKRFRERVVAVVLATDMTRHGSDIAKMKELVASSDFDLTNNAKGKDLAMELIVHASDISNPIRPFKDCREWAERITKEFQNQGDQERARGLPISFGCDKYASNIADGQIGFLNFVIEPLFKTITTLLPETEESLKNLHNNVSEWGNLKEEYGQKLSNNPANNS